MSDEVRPPELQFEHAETTAPPAGLPRCALCQSEISTSYYERNAQTICSICRDRLLAERERSSRFSRFGRALLFGSAAAVAGSLLWYAVARLTRYEFSLIAIVIGFLVGSAVRAGCHRRGGWAYQALAMFLTYTSIVSTYIPAILEAFQEGAAEAAPTTVEETTAARDSDAAPSTLPLAAAEGDPSAEPGLAPDTPENSAPAPTPGDEVADEVEVANPSSELGLGGPLGYVVGVAAIFALAFAAPFLSGFENFMGWIILAIGLYEAWKLNRKETLHFEGPFAVGDASRAPFAEAPAPPLST